MMIKELVYKNRSYRRFYESELVDRDMLIDLVDLGRVSPSGRNLQSLKYFISNDSVLNDKIFPNLAWAGYLKEWAGPVEGERPSAYVIILEDTLIGTGMVHDQGIVCQSILLGAVENGLGGCIIASVKKKELATILNLPAHLHVALVVALGRPKEEVVIDDISETGDVKYWRDAQEHHHVPKRLLEDVLINL